MTAVTSRPGGRHKAKPCMDSDDDQRRKAVGILLPDGITRPYRPCPRDFRAVFLEIGWDGIEDHYRTNWRIIRRWIEECGGEELRAARRAVSGGTPRPNLRSENRARRYVMGQTLRKKV